MPTEHRAIVAVDVASFTDPARSLTHLRAVQEGLYEMLRTSFDESGIPWKTCYVEDRGDGAMILVSPEFPKLWLADQWQSRLLAALREHNANHSDPARVQLRVALHHGEVYANNEGVISQAVNHAFRILDAKPAKAALAAAGAMLALVVSDEFYREVVSQEPAADPDSYRRIAVSVKETETIAWLRLSGGYPPAVHSPAQAGTPVVNPLFAIAEALLDLPFVRDAGGRAMLIELLPRDIANTAPYNSVARLHVIGLVQTCMRHDNGLAELVDAVRRLDGESSTAVRQIEWIKRAHLSGSDH
ncbi:MAG: hypothetical protein ABW224_18810 [Kibdelosporangium sp.]